jgi:hypothetical protein
MIGKLPKSYFTQGTRAETLCRNPMDSGRASALNQTRAEKPYRTLKDSDRASTLELWGGLLTGREALQPSKPHGWLARWSGLHLLSPPPWPSTPWVDMCPRSHRPNRHKTWPAGQGVWLAGRPFGPFGLGFGPLGPCVKYTPVVMMILIFGQFYFVIPWNAPI